MFFFSFHSNTMFFKRNVVEIQTVKTATTLSEHSYSSAISTSVKIKHKLR